MIDKLGIFEVGHRYENRKGHYEVLTISPPLLRIRYDSGEVTSVDITTQARIIENMSRSPAPEYAKDRKLTITHGTGHRPRRSKHSAGIVAPSGRMPETIHHTDIEYKTREFV